MRTTQCWFVWNPVGLNPRFEHPSEESARTEARRLALANPGREFLVLKSVASFEHDSVRVSEHDDRGPF